MRDHPRALSGVLVAFVLVLVAAGLLGQQPDARAQSDNKAWKPVTLLYLSDTRGKIEPCG